ncbi:AlpA family transcriptional regulator [Marinomonas sp.]|uniref:AlpA family transcriptional regulator n=1 Tax=Marinomonas sp. TaxID=1904862 RepID=UPI003A902150
MRFMKLKEVIRVTGLGRSSVYSFMSKGEFPQNITLGERAVGWLESEVLEWMQDKLKQRDEASFKR